MSDTAYGCIFVRVASLGQSCQCVKWLWLSDDILRHRTGTTLDQAMAYCHTASSHHLDHCWLIVKCVQWGSPEGSHEVPMNLVRSMFRTLHFKITTTYRMGRWVENAGTVSNYNKQNEHGINREHSSAMVLFLTSYFYIYGWYYHLRVSRCCIRCWSLRGPLLQTWTDFTPYKCGMKLCSNFNGAAVKVWKWISNLFPPLNGHVIAFPCWD